MKNLKKWFTLVEILVAVTIFTIIMMSVMSVYITSTKTSYNAEINRAIQENVKNIVTTLSEEIYKNKIIWVWQDCSHNSCNFEETNWNALKIANWNEYKLIKKDWDDFRVIGWNECENVTNPENICYLWVYKNNKFSPITNNLVNIKNISLKISGWWTGLNKTPKKVTINMKIEPSLKSGVSSTLRESSSFDFQITLSERPYNKDVSISEE